MSTGSTFSPITFHFAKLGFRDKGEKPVISHSVHARTNYRPNFNLLRKLEGQKVLNGLRLAENFASLSCRSLRTTGDKIVTVPSAS